MTGGPRLAAADIPPPLGRGPVKLVIEDYALPSLDTWCAGCGPPARPAGPWPSTA